MIDQVEFPVITLSQRLVAGVRSLDAFSTASAHAIKMGYFRQLHVIDSGGKEFVVTGCTVRSEPFWRRPRTPLGRGVRISQFEISAGSTANLEDVKARVIAAVEDEEGDWSAGGRVAEIVALVRASNSVADIIQIFVAA